MTSWWISREWFGIVPAILVVGCGVLCIGRKRKITRYSISYDTLRAFNILRWYEAAELGCIEEQAPKEPIDGSVLSLTSISGCYHCHVVTVTANQSALPQSSCCNYWDELLCSPPSSLLAIEAETRQGPILRHSPRFLKHLNKNGELVLMLAEADAVPVLHEDTPPLNFSVGLGITSDPMVRGGHRRKYVYKALQTFMS